MDPPEGGRHAIDRCLNARHPPIGRRGHVHSTHAIVVVSDF
jgi:hypothetical protein